MAIETPNVPPAAAHTLIKGGLVLIPSKSAAAAAGNDTVSSPAAAAPLYVVERLDVLIKGNTIVEMQEHIAAPADAVVIDADRKIIIPGMVDTHRHLWQTPFRSMPADMTLIEFLSDINIVLAAHMTPDEIYVAQMCGALEAINTGVTTVVDHFHINNSPAHARSGIRASIDSGLRVCFCVGTNPCLDPARCQGPEFKTGRIAFKDLAWQYDDIINLATDPTLFESKTHGDSDKPRVTLGVSLDRWRMEPPAATAAFVQRCRESDIKPITIHVSDGAFGPTDEPVVKLDARSAAGEKTSADNTSGLLGTDFLLSHANFLTDKELTLCEQRGVSLSATPECEAYLNMGEPITRRGNAAGVCVGLGVDTAALSEANYFTVMRMALAAVRLYENQKYIDAGKFPIKTPILCESIFRDATIQGAKAAQLAHLVGDLQPGKRADLVLLDLDSPNMAGTAKLHPAAAVVTHASLADVHTVLIDGRVVKRDGKLVGVDMKAWARRLEQTAEDVLERAKAVDVDLVREKMSRVLGLTDRYCESV
ncbi:hypothetical protein HDU87_004344 [Geranomyces variabilis]|uniref:Amidohydrolase-related domain-containing protein n=1 Tax=Geranomyces variabilis TaxID=109894 RepID=A0AAD5TJ67_9FUNG|nr:hypothetical protein HDU87_004344 [Geranomyces variabilis]